MNLLSESIKVPLFVEVIGEPSSGKTHIGCLFPKPAIFDSTPKKESYVVIKKLYPDWKRRHFPIRCFKDIRDGLIFLSKAENANEFKTAVFDTSADLRVLGSREYLKELSAAGKERQALLPVEYKWVNEKIDAVIDKITSEMGMNLVFTSQMRDEWGTDSKPTGRRIRKGYPDANFQADIRLFLQITKKLDTKTMQYIEGEFERKCTVLKNRFRDQANKEEWVSDLKDLSWEGIKKLTKLEVGEVVE